MSILSKNTKNIPKNAKKNNLLTTKRIVHIKMSAKEGPAFTFSLPGERLAPVGYTTARWMALNWSCLRGWGGRVTLVFPQVSCIIAITSFLKLFPWLKVI